MNKEAIKILTSEPCASWLRERWRERGPQIDDLVNTSRNDFFHLSAHRLQAVADFRIYGMTMWWLPRVEDFLGENGLLRQAGAWHYDFKHIGKRRPQLYIGKAIMSGAAWEVWDDDSALLVFAQALQWLLEQREAEEENTFAIEGLSVMEEGT